MLFSIKNMPESVSRKQLHQIVEHAMHHFWFPLRRKGSIESLDIIKIQNGDKRTAEYHGVVEIEPDGIALVAMKRLSRSTLWGRQVSVGPYAIRSAYRDRRGHKPHKEDLRVIDRRKGDRRKSHLIMNWLADEQVVPRSRHRW